MIKLTTVEFEVAQIIQNNPKTLKDIREELFRSKFRTNVFHSWIEPIRNLEMYLNPKVFEIDGEIANGDELVTLLKNLTDLEISKYSFKMNYNIFTKSSRIVQVVSQIEYKILHAVFDNFVSFGALWKTVKSNFTDVLEIVNFIEDRPHLFSVFRFSEYECFVMPNMAIIKNLDNVKLENENKPGRYERKKTVKDSKISFLCPEECLIATLLSQEIIGLQGLYYRLKHLDELENFEKFNTIGATGALVPLKCFLEARQHLFKLKIKPAGGHHYSITNYCQNLLIEEKKNSKRPQNIVNLETSVGTGTNEIKGTNSLSIVTEIIEDILTQIVGCAQTNKNEDNVIMKHGIESIHRENNSSTNSSGYEQMSNDSKISFLSSEELMIAKLLSKEKLGVPALYRRLKRCYNLAGFKKFKIQRTLKKFLAERPHLFELKIHSGGHHYEISETCLSFLLVQKNDFSKPHNIDNTAIPVGPSSNGISQINSSTCTIEITKDTLMHIAGYLSNLKNLYNGKITPKYFAHTVTERTRDIECKFRYKNNLYNTFTENMAHQFMIEHAHVFVEISPRARVYEIREEFRKRCEIIPSNLSKMELAIAEIMGNKPVTLNYILSKVQWKDLPNYPQEGILDFIIARTNMFEYVTNEGFHTSDQFRKMLHSQKPAYPTNLKEDIILEVEDEEASDDVELEPIVSAEQDHKTSWWTILYKIISTPLKFLKGYIIHPIAMKMFYFCANIVSRRNLSSNHSNPQEFKSCSKDHEEQLKKLKSNLQNLLSLMEKEGEPLHSKKVQLVKDTIEGFDEFCSRYNHDQTILSITEQACNCNMNSKNVKEEFNQIFREFAPKEQINNENILQL